MRQSLKAIAIWLILAVPVSAQEDPVQRVINQQLTAFLEDDFETAFSYASPEIKRLFLSPGQFERMVRRGYPMVHRPAEVTMLDQRNVADRVIQRVMIRDLSGRLHFLVYQMIDTPDGWQIAGVQILRGSDTGT